jgi:predicted transcriptional regulator of viral defense system
VKNASGIDTKKRRLLDLLNRLGKNIFSIEEAATITGLTIIEARLLLGYFARRGWLARVKPGLYTSVPLGTVNPQEYKENPWIVANRIFAPCYIGGWSAAEHWDLTDQIFNSIYVCTLKVFRNKAVNVQGTDFVLKRKKESGHIKTVWIENTKIQVSDPAQTVVDILDDPSAGGGMRHVSEIVKNYFDSEHHDKFDLSKYLSECKNRTVYKRLGFIVETLKIDAAALVEECRKNMSVGYSVFDPQIKIKGIYNRRWNLRVNAEI